jgi:hypothetical protein
MKILTPRGTQTLIHFPGGFYHLFSCFDDLPGIDFTKRAKGRLDPSFALFLRLFKCRPDPVFFRKNHPLRLLAVDK